MVIQIFNQGFNEGIQRLLKAKKVFNRLWDAVLSRIVKGFQQDFYMGLCKAMGRKPDRQHSHCKTPKHCWPA